LSGNIPRIVRVGGEEGGKQGSCPGVVATLVGFGCSFEGESAGEFGICLAGSLRESSDGLLGMLGIPEKVSGETDDAE